MGRLLEKLLTSLLGGVALVTLAASGCREHEDLCRGARCSPSITEPDGGGAGEPADYARGGAEGGAPAAMPDCIGDSDCSDGLECNGPESCVNGGCVREASPTCTLGTRCVEGPGAAVCHFPEPSPWLIVTNRGIVYGLPVAQLGQQDLFLLGEKDTATGFSGFPFYEFSHDSRRLWLHFYHGAFRTVSMFEVTLGRGLPGLLTPVPDLPTTGSFLTPIFSADSRHAFITDEFSGSYLFDFDDDDASRSRGRLLGTYQYEWPAEAAFCKDSELLVVPGHSTSDPDAEIPSSSAWFIDGNDGGQLRATELGVGATAVARDGSLFTLVTSDRVELFACERELARVELADGEWALATFHRDSAYVELSREYEHRIYSLARPDEPVLVYSCSECQLSWSDDDRLIQVETDDESVWLELRGDEPPLPRPGATPEDVLGVELAERVQAQGSRTFLVQGLEQVITDGGAGGAGGEASVTTSEFGIVDRDEPERIVPIVREGVGHSESSLEWSDLDAGLALVSRDAGSLTQLWLLRFAEAPFTEELVAAGVGSCFVSVSPDRSGFAYVFSPWDTAEASEVTWKPFDPARESVPLGVTGEVEIGPLPP